MSGTGKGLALALLLGGPVLAGCAASSGAPAPGAGLEPTVVRVLETRRSGDPLVLDGGRTRIVVLGTWRRRDGTYCRRYRIDREGEPAVVGFACRAKGGRWYPVETGTARSI